MIKAAEIDNETLDRLEDRVLELYKSAGEEWLSSDDAAYKRLLELSQDPELAMCIVRPESITIEDWTEFDVFAEDVAEHQLVQFTLIYADEELINSEEDEVDLFGSPKTVVVQEILLSADPEDDFCVIKWFPEN